MSDIENVGGKPSIGTIASGDSSPASTASTEAKTEGVASPAAATDGEAASEAPSPDNRKTRRAKASGTGKPKAEALQSPQDDGAKSRRSKSRKGEETIASAVSEVTGRKPKKGAGLEPFIPTPEQTHVLAGLERDLSESARSDVEMKLKMGDCFILATEILPHGHLVNWVKKHCGIDDRYMRQIRRMSEVFPERRRQQVRASGLNFTSVLALSEASSKLQDKILSAASEGQKYQVADIKAEIREERPSKAPDAAPKPKPDMPGLAGLRAAVSAYTLDAVKRLNEDLVSLKTAVLAALETNRTKGRINKGKLVDDTADKATACLVALRNLAGRVPVPKASHEGEVPGLELRGWDAVVSALAELQKLGHGRSPTSLAQDLEFEVLEPLIWATAKAVAADRSDNDAAQAVASDDGNDQANEAA